MYYGVYMLYCLTAMRCYRAYLNKKRLGLFFRSYHVSATSTEFYCFVALRTVKISTFAAVTAAYVMMSD